METTIGFKDRSALGNATLFLLVHNISFEENRRDDNGSDPLHLPGKSPMSKVCFSVCLLTVLLHNLLVTTNVALRRVYGLDLLVALYTMLFLHFSILLSCFLDANTVLCVLLGIIVHFTALCIPCAVLVTVINVWRTVYNGGTLAPSSQLFAVRVKSLGFTFALPLGIIFLGLILNFAQPHSPLSPGYGARVCGFGCIEGYRHLLFIPILLLFFVQLPFLLSLAKMHTSNMSERKNAANQPDLHARFSMVTKLVVTNVIVWLSAFLANQVCMSVMWHLFTLFSALQAIFIFINFTFSRHFFDVYFKRCEQVPKECLKMNSTYAPSSYTVPLLGEQHNNTAGHDSAHATTFV